MLQLSAKTKVIFLVVILILLFGGFFYYWYWNRQKDVRELNKSLPEGINVVKNLDNEYIVKNTLDGYEFKIPTDWQGIEEINYTPKQTELNYTASSLGIKGKNGNSIIMAIDQFENKDRELTLEDWAIENFNTFSLIGNFEPDEIDNINIVKTREEVHLLGMWVYFFKNNDSVYAITNGSEEYIRYIISNGKW